MDYAGVLAQWLREQAALQALTSCVYARVLTAAALRKSDACVVVNERPEVDEPTYGDAAMVTHVAFDVDVYANDAGKLAQIVDAVTALLNGQDGIAVFQGLWLTSADVPVFSDVSFRFRKRLSFRGALK